MHNVTVTIIVAVKICTENGSKDVDELHGALVLQLKLLGLLKT